jgi:hypothetical protein
MFLDMSSRHYVCGRNTKYDSTDKETLTAEAIQNSVGYALDSTYYSGNAWEL